MFSLERVHALPRDSVIKLRRAFGKDIEGISLENAIAFYSVAPQDMTKREECDMFFVVTMYCHYQDNADKGIRFTDAVSKYYHRCTESGQKEVLSLMDASYDMHGTFLSRMYSLINKMESKEIYVDAKDLYQELHFWDAKSKTRKVQIAKSIVSFKEDE